MWRTTWDLRIKGKIKHFIWKACHNILPTLDNISKKGIQVDKICKLRGEANESVEHVLLTCTKAQEIWQRAPISWDGLNHLTESFIDWWQEICKLQNWKINQDRKEGTAYLLWNIWKMRNEWFFNSKKVEGRELINKAMEEWQEFSTVQEEEIKSRQAKPQRRSNTEEETETKNLGRKRSEASPSGELLKILTDRS